MHEKTNLCTFFNEVARYEFERLRQDDCQKDSLYYSHYYGAGRSYSLRLQPLAHTQSTQKTFRIRLRLECLELEKKGIMDKSNYHTLKHVLVLVVGLQRGLAPAGHMILVRESSVAR